MPFTKVNAIAEAAELQEIFKDDEDTREMFRQYELAHIRNANGTDDHAKIPALS